MQLSALIWQLLVTSLAPVPVLSQLVPGIGRQDGHRRVRTAGTLLLPAGGSLPTQESVEGVVRAPLELST